MPLLPLTPIGYGGLCPIKSGADQTKVTSVFTEMIVPLMRNSYIESHINPNTKHPTFHFCVFS